MQKQTNPYHINKGMIFFVLKIINALFGKIFLKRADTSATSNKMILQNKERNSFNREVKIMSKKYSKPPRIVTNHIDTPSTVEVRSGSLHIRLVPLTKEEQQKKRVKGYKYLTV